jgi:hypothetical protein
MILTIPVGVDTVVKTKHRVYGKKRLPLLISDYKVLKEVFWIKDSKNRWITSSKQKALSFKTSNYFYNLGCFVLSK